MIVGGVAAGSGGGCAGWVAAVGGSGRLWEVVGGCGWREVESGGAWRVLIGFVAGALVPKCGYVYQ